MDFINFVILHTNRHLGTHPPLHPLSIHIYDWLGLDLGFFTHIILTYSYLHDENYLILLLINGLLMVIDGQLDLLDKLNVNLLRIGYLTMRSRILLNMKGSGYLSVRHWAENFPR